MTSPKSFHIERTKCFGATSGNGATFLGMEGAFVAKGSMNALASTSKPQCPCNLRINVDFYIVAASPHHPFPEPIFV